MKLNDLYNKVKNFEDNISKDTLSLSQCKKGCSRCCYVDLSVFSLESENIKDWFINLTKNEQIELINKWKTKRNSMLNFHNDESESCIFLYEESCTIYPVRPLICRTQGLAITFVEDKQKFLDICPLNIELIDKLEQKEILNLDVLNHILSQLQLHYQKSSKRINLKDFASELASLT